MDFADSNLAGQVLVTFNPKNNTFTIDPGQTNIFSKATFGFVATTGTITGSFTPANGKPFTCALALPKSSSAYGFFLDTDQSGSILLRDAP